MSSSAGRIPLVLLTSLLACGSRTELDVLVSPHSTVGGNAFGGASGSRGLPARSSAGSAVLTSSATEHWPSLGSGGVGTSTEAASGGLVSSNLQLGASAGVNAGGVSAGGRGFGGFEIAGAGAHAGAAGALSSAGTAGAGQSTDCPTPCPTGTQCSNGRCSPKPCTGTLLLGSVPMADAGAPTVLATGDFDRDGLLDVVTGGSHTRNVTLLYGKGDGTFGRRRDIPIRGDNASVAVGDLNQDGRLDIVTGNGEASRLSVLLQRSDGEFSASADYATGYYTSAVAIADLNGDSHLDCVAVNRGGVYPAGKISVLLGSLDGVLSPIDDIETDFPAEAIRIGDVNRDGHADLILANGYSASSISVLLGFGDGSFAHSGTFATDDRPTAIALADLNDDGRLDVLANSGSQLGGIDLLYGKGDGSFDKPSHVATPAYVDSIDVGDANGDGKLDIIGAAPLWGAYVILGHGDANFDAPVEYVTPVSMSLRFADVNGDGRLDFIGIEPHLGMVGVLLSEGDGRFVTRSKVSVGGSPTALAAGDLNRDGRPDLITVNAFASTVSVLRNRGQRSFAPAVNYSVGEYPHALWLGDLDRDGQLDALTASVKSSTVAVAQGMANGTLAPALEYATAAPPYTVAAGDLNGDQRLDIVTASGQPNSVEVLLAESGGGFAQPVSYTIAASIETLSIVDVDANGTLDILAAGSGTAVSCLLGAGDGTFVLHNVTARGNSSGMVTADFDRDGWVDVALSFYDTGAIELFRGAWQGFGEGTIIGSMPLRGSTPAAGDLNGDGAQDLVLASPASLVVMLGHNDGTFAAPLYYPSVNTGPNSVVITDLDGDQRPDIALTDPTDDDLTILYNQCLE